MAMYSSPGRAVTEMKGESDVTSKVYDVLVGSDIVIRCKSDPRLQDEVCIKAVRHVKKNHNEDIDED